MKKILVTVFVIAMVLCLAMCFVACGNSDKTNGNTSDDGKVEYKVTVTCEAEPSAVLAIQVKLQNTDGTDATDFVALTNGVATFKVKPATYKVVLGGLLDRVDVPDVTLTSMVKEATVALTPKDLGGSQLNKDIEYKLTLLGLDGKPVSGVTIQVCSTGVGGACRNETTDENGVATYNLKAGEYNIHILEEYWPEGGCFADGMEFTVSATQTSSTISFQEAVKYSVSVVDFAEQPLANQVVTFSMMYENQNLVVDATTDAYGKASVFLPSAVYSIKAKNVGENYVAKSCTVDPETNSGVVRILKRGSTVDSGIIIGGDSEINVTLNAEQNEVWFELVTKQAGVYSIQSEGNVDTACSHYHGTTDFVYTGNAYPCPVDRQDKSDNDKNFYMQFRIEPYDIEAGSHNVFVFKVSANTSEQCSFKLKVALIEKLYQVNIPTTTPHAEQVKAPIEPQSDRAVALAYGQGIKVVYNEQDGLYHLQNTSGAIIFVAVAGNKYLPQNFDKYFYAAYSDENCQGIGFVISDGKTYEKDYGVMLLEYSQQANSDGLTPLTQELMEFLQGYSTVNGTYAALDWDKNLEPDNLYYFGCYYYI